MNKQSKVTDATRDAFIDAFFILAKKKNIKQITIREITDLAGYNRTTFYRYFEDVYALIEYTEDEFLDDAKKALSKQCGDEQINERQFFETLIQCFHQNTERVSVLLSEQNRSHFLRKIEENLPNSLQNTYNSTPKKIIIRDIYFYGIFHAISINLKNKNFLPDEDLLDLIQKLFDNWFLPEITKDA